MPPVTLTADFSPFPDNTTLGPSFVLSGFEFTDLSASPSFVNESGTEKGLQFDRLGVRVKLPAATDAVRVRGAGFAGPYRIYGKDAAGNTLASERIPGDNLPHTVQLAHPGIEVLEFVEGGNEGLIETISTTVCRDVKLAWVAPSAATSILEGRVSGLDVQAWSGETVAFAFITPDDIADEIQVVTTSHDRVEASFIPDDSQRILTRLRILDR